MSKDAQFGDLKGATLVSVTGLREGSDLVEFFSADGRRWAMHHVQECCESVSVESVTGDVEDILNTPIELAYESSHNESAVWGDSSTWTFYRLQTIKGSLVIRWLGESNGYYSESVSFVERTK